MVGFTFLPVNGSWQIAGLTFHAYGLVVGLAIVLGLWLAEKRAKAAGISATIIDKIGLGTIVMGVLGARAWHVMTDWPAYADQPWQVFYVWQGGLSIIGAVVVGSLTAWWLAKHYHLQFGTLLDAATFGLPAGQALGRLGNALNQELYGLPTNLPWGIPIDSAHRLPGYELSERFHPLFGYEMLATGSFVAGLWWWDRHYPTAKKFFGRGYVFGTYVWFYSLIRFLLDLLRIGPVYWSWFGLSLNQFFLLMVMGGVGMWLFRQGSGWWRWLVGLGTGVGLVAAILVVVGFAPLSTLQPPALQSSLPQPSDLTNRQYDHRLLEIMVNDQSMVVEVVNSEASITQGLSGRDKVTGQGMLFILPHRTQAVFWMKEMQFDLDLVWIDQETIQGVTAQVPKPVPGTPLANLPTYRAPTIVNWVLELPAGVAEKMNLKPGARIHLRRWL